MTTKSLVKSKMGLQRAASIMPYLTPEEVYQMAEDALRIQQQVEFGRQEGS